MNKSSIRLASQWLAVPAVVFLMGPAGAVASDHAPQSHRIAGIWNARVNITNCEAGNVPGSVVFASFDTMNAFEADGTFLDANAQNPATQSAHLGYWRHIRGRRYEFAQKFFLFDAAGASIGWRIVRHEIRLSSNGFGFTSRGTAETFDSDGLLLSTGCSTSSAIRFD
jgi:hypothetical protein